MKKFLSITFLTLILVSCSNGQIANSLPATKFSAKLKGLPNAPIIDVRTPAEFSNGHLENALNYDWNGTEFENQIGFLDKSKPVFVYCLSGGRSSEAASKMRAEGFKEVYEMEGGLMQWRSQNLPETTRNEVVSKGMSKQDFEVLINSDKLVLIDFYADWCVPCKKMEPYLNEIANDLKNTVTVIRINADENQELCKELQISAIPVLQIYKKKKLIWTNTGFIEKSEVLKQL
ncbi:thioredoxin domain-containing protein [Fluviicola taffensis]|uniref:Thioredoxin domain-containing protein n=1 Tax=Fluviicola taffensis (strain DSM 16823 / NCIMB 13979 / RW262) TaxID=755732 RepID=F2IHR6_FLUTR|nr:thioredoxin domain-containing protein [Fluviicola taffensis]AEA44844.1 Thioredoxin domain-containing protein [Fluviicola taffensis DSM 16823]